MTSDNFRSELEKDPFVRFRIHMASGKTVEVKRVGQTHLLQTTVIVFKEMNQRQRDTMYDIIDLRNIERLEQLEDLVEE